MAAPLYDHSLAHRAKTLGHGAHVHRLNNLLTMYEGYWYLGQKYGWTQDRHAAFVEAEVNLRQFLTRIALAETVCLPRKSAGD